MGNVGSVLMWVLLYTLVIGLGILAWRVLGFSIADAAKKEGKVNTAKGGIRMYNNSWFKLALVSFVGIVISAFALGLINMMTPGINTGQNMNATGMNIMGTSTTPMGTAAAPMPMAMGGAMAVQPTNDAYYMQLQINDIRRQLMQMQLTLNQIQGGMSGMSAMPPAGGGMAGMPPAGGMAGMGMSGMGMGMSSGGGMGAMPPGGMSAMPPAAGGTSSGGGGGMGGMPMM